MTSAGTPWVELYRPKSLKDVSHQSEVVATLQNAVETGRMPHLLFYGPPGSGKTSVALALCRQLWHPSDWKRRVLELNASDERGISVVREKIKNFASLAIGKPQESFFSKKKDEDSMDVEEKKYPNPPFKIIVLDEADTVTPDAQAALRRIIEAHSKITRFILICNYVTRVIEPLASRCAKFRFQALPPASMRDRLLTIAQAEGCSEQEISLVDEILEQADGDMRRAVTTLQSVHSLAVGSQPLTKDIISEIAGLPPVAVMDQLWRALGADGTAATFDSMQKMVESIAADGYSAKLLLSALLTKVINDSTLSELDKAQLAIRVAEAEKCMMDGADEYLQLLTACSHALGCFSRSSQGSAKQ